VLAEGPMHFAGKLHRSFAAETAAQLDKESPQYVSASISGSVIHMQKERLNGLLPVKA